MKIPRPDPDGEALISRGSMLTGTVLRGGSTRRRHDERLVPSLSFSAAGMGRNMRNPARAPPVHYAIVRRSNGVSRQRQRWRVAV